MLCPYDGDAQGGTAARVTWKRGPSAALRARERRGKSEGARNFAQDDRWISGEGGVAAVPVGGLFVGEGDGEELRFAPAPADEL